MMRSLCVAALAATVWMGFTTGSETPKVKADDGKDGIASVRFNSPATNGTITYGDSCDGFYSGVAATATITVKVYDSCNVLQQTINCTLTQTQGPPNIGGTWTSGPLLVPPTTGCTFFVSITGFPASDTETNVDIVP